MTARATMPVPIYASGLEEAYADFLGTLIHAEIVLQWDYQPERLLLGDGAWYTPDFRVVTASQAVEFHEVKGHWREAARVRIKVAAGLHPYVFRACTKPRGRGWQFECFTPGAGEFP